jgi:hypothetical protein
MKKTFIDRYWLCWRASRPNKLCENVRTKLSTQFVGTYVENLETGEVIQNELSFRSLGEMKLRIEKDGFKMRRRALNALEAIKRKATRAAQKKAAARSPEKKLESLRAIEKTWIRKAKLAATKLKKLRGRIKRLQASASEEQSATESPRPQ